MLDGAIFKAVQGKLRPNFVTGVVTLSVGAYPLQLCSCGAPPAWDAGQRLKTALPQCRSIFSRSSGASPRESATRWCCSAHWTKRR
jgi:hypothetical protein